MHCQSQGVLLLGREKNQSRRWRLRSRCLNDETYPKLNRLGDETVVASTAAHLNGIFQPTDLEAARAIIEFISKL